MKNPSPTQERPHATNSDFPWDDFDSCFYYDHNYRTLRDDDRKIVISVRDFLSRLHDSGEIGDRLDGLDVGSGANLYPAFTMLPLCRSITMWEHATSNVAWLEKQIKSFDPSWDAFWSPLADDPLYGNLEGGPRRALSARASVTHDSIFNLPYEKWDIGTMFFVAESLTPDMDEFRTATRRFLQALRPGAPFAAAFMEESSGYLVGEQRFPAVAVKRADVEECLEGYCLEYETFPIELDDKPLRDGYSGMILATGKTNGRKAI